MAAFELGRRLGKTGLPQRGIVGQRLHRKIEHIAVDQADEAQRIAATPYVGDLPAQRAAAAARGQILASANDSRLDEVLELLAKSRSRLSTQEN